MRWFRTKKDIKAEEEQTFRDNLSAKLADYKPSDEPHADFAIDLSPVDPYGDLGLDADPSWLPRPNSYSVEEIALSDLTDSEIEVVARLRQSYLANLREREFLDDPDTQQLNNLLRGD